MTAPAFETQRLKVRPWDSTLAETSSRAALESALSELLTPAVLKHLPDPLQLSASVSIAHWIDARAAQSDVLLVASKASDTLIGLMILSKSTAPTDPIHIGYLLAQSAWGQGLASELVGGLVATLKDHGPACLIGGVEPSNPASAKVLLKAGFARQNALSTPDADIYRLDLA